MRIAFITDGNNTLGMGHVVQSMTLAKYLCKEMDDESKVFFITGSGSVVTDRLSAAGFDVFWATDNESTMKVLKDEIPDRVIFDKLDVPPLLAKNIKESLEVRLIIFTNLTRANQYADVTVLADIGSNFRNVCFRNRARNTSHYFGPKYWLLRPEFYQTGERKRSRSTPVRNIMLIFGGSDPANLTLSVVNQLLTSATPFQILVVLGPAYAKEMELQSLLSTHGMRKSKVTIVRNLDNVAGAMSDADLVMASPGLSFFEALSVGTPVIGFHQNELQKSVYKDVLATWDKSEVFKLDSIIESRSFIFPDDPMVVSMEIGKGRDEIIQEILLGSHA